MFENKDSAPVHSERPESRTESRTESTIDKFQEEARHGLANIKLELAPENPGQNPEISAMLAGFSLFERNENPGCSNPLDQAFMGLLTQGGDATPGQNAAMGIGESVMSGLFSALSGGDSGSAPSSDYSGSSDSSGSSDDSDGSNSSDITSTPQDDTSYNPMPSWMSQFARS
jgi:hypothetical protein